MGVKLDKATLAGHGTPIGRPSAICLNVRLPMGVKDHFIPLKQDTVLHPLAVNTFENLKLNLIQENCPAKGCNFTKTTPISRPFTEKT